MGTPAQLQTQTTPPAVLHAAAMKPRQRTGTIRDLPFPTVSPTQTHGVTPGVFPRFASGKPSAKDCTTEQLVEIVIDVAQRFRTAKEIVVEYKDYILRLRSDVFKVRLGSFGVKVPVKCRVGNGRHQTRRMRWAEFCETQFGVTADWIYRLCSGKAEATGNSAKAEKRGPELEAILTELLDALEPCANSLPMRAKDALHAAQELLERDGEAEDNRSEPQCAERYWLTPRDIYATLDREFRFDFDPCPCPKPDGFNSLEMEWGKSSYVNPPFHTWNGGGKGPTAWVRKAVEEHKKGKQVVLLLPVQSYVNLLLEAGAEIRSAGRVRWLEADTRQPCTSPSPIACFILRPRQIRA